jgi:hypothetical protein
VCWKLKAGHKPFGTVFPLPSMHGDVGMGSTSTVGETGSALLWKTMAAFEAWYTRAGVLALTVTGASIVAAGPTGVGGSQLITSPVS